MKIEYRPRSRKKLIREFTGTPLQTGDGQDIICPHFWVLSYVTGCPFSCEFCYLRKTMRRVGTHLIVYGDDHRLYKAVRKWLNRDEPSVLNAGELADSLVADWEIKMVPTLRWAFSMQNKHHLLLLTKSHELAWLDLLPPTPQVIVSFSLNVLPVIRSYEKGTPMQIDRLRAAKQAKSRGWRVRIRIDPMIPIKDWEGWYAELADKVNALAPERVTLGSLRALPGLPKWAASDVWEYAPQVDGADRRRRCLILHRLAMYSSMMDWLDGPEIGLCKETKEVWNALELDPLSPKCNCIL